MALATAKVKLRRMWARLDRFWAFILRNFGEKHGPNAPQRFGLYQIRDYGEVEVTDRQI